MATEMVKLRIYGMTCEDCVDIVTQDLREQEGVVDAKVSLKDRGGEVTYDPEKINPEDILKNRAFRGTSHYRATIGNQ